MTVLIMMCFFCNRHPFLCLSNNSVLITAFTQALCKQWPCLPIQHIARVGGLMEYGSNWPPIQQYGLQVILSSEHTQMDAHIFFFPVFSLCPQTHWMCYLYSCSLYSLALLLCTYVLRDKICFHRYQVQGNLTLTANTALISHQRICFRKYIFLFVLLFVGQMNKIILHPDYVQQPR